MIINKNKDELRKNIEFLEVASLLVITLYNLANEEEYFFNFSLA